MFLAWEELTFFQQSVFAIALTATIILLVFLVLMIFGIHGDTYDGTVDFDDPSFDHDVTDGVYGHDGADLAHGDSFNDEPLSSFAGLKLFTVRGVLAFLSMGGWVAFAVSKSLGVFWAVLFGLLAGSIAAILVAYAFKQVMRLEASGNLHYENALGKKAEVYIRVPANRNGKGKVNLLLQERYVEADAITDNEEDLKTGTRVVVTGVEDENTIIVSKEK